MNRNRNLNRRAFVAGSAVLAAALATGCAQGTQEAEPEQPAADEQPEQEAAATGTLFPNPGTYTGTALGRNGDVNVTVSVTDDAIESVEHDSKETVTIGIAAMDRLADAVVANQSIAVDSISGATFSSAAFIGALADAVQQAGADPAALRTPIEATAPDYITEADIIVVGTGGAGLTAARRATDDGASVILLEKSGVVGGNTNCIAQGPNAAGSKTQEALGSTYTVEQMMADQSEDPKARPNLVEALVVNSGEMIDWYAESCGMEFELDDHMESVVKMKNYIPGLEGHDAPSSGVLAVDTVHKQLAENPDVAIYTDIAAESLIVDDNGAVVGVTATDTLGNTVDFTGKAVILAAGGYSFNHDIIDAANPALKNAGSDQVAPVTGDAILMAQDMGADVVDLGEVENSGFVCTTMKVSQYMGEADCGWNPEVHRGIPRGFFVNKEGERFTSETDFTRETILNQTDGYAFHIFPANEETVRDGIARFIELGIVKRASSPEELAGELGIDAATFAESLAAWNEGAEAGADPLGRDDEGVVPIDENDLCGYPFQNTIHYTMGGILIDENAHVLDTFGDPIPGLYAAGETTGGVHGGTRRDGSGITDALTFGYVAGKTVVAELA